MLCTIVGVGPGLGAALARRFAAGGCRIALVARRPEPLAEIVAERGGHPSRAFPADAADPVALGKAFAEVRAWAGDSDILIYNAAAAVPCAASGLGPARILQEMATNLGGAVASVGCTLPAMRRRGRGTILLTGGGLAFEPYPDWASLAAGKAALRAYAIALHKEVAAEGVHVATVAICGLIAKGGPFDPDLIAERYWALHQEPPGSFTRELVYRPEGSDPHYNDPARGGRA